MQVYSQTYYQNVKITCGIMFEHSIHNNFDSVTKIFSDPYLANFQIGTSVKSFFPSKYYCRESYRLEKKSEYIHLVN